MSNYFSLLAFVFLFLCCSFSCQDQDEKSFFIEGNYSGTFERNGEQANVELTFSNGTFEGTSERVKFPALCKGTYTLTPKEITFQNECPWTAEFDWTLILNGKWEYQQNANELVLENELGDLYELSKN
ncbi:hypothetical protein JYB64_07090 [Algoriphagus aestuarii]|nr:hypothetical protein [Algoriphagus aestuarii]